MKAVPHPAVLAIAFVAVLFLLSRIVVVLIFLLWEQVVEVTRLGRLLSADHVVVSPQVEVQHAFPVDAASYSSGLAHVLLQHTVGETQEFRLAPFLREASGVRSLFNIKKRKRSIEETDSANTRSSASCPKLNAERGLPLPGPWKSRPDVDM